MVENDLCGDGGDIRRSLAVAVETGGGRKRRREKTSEVETGVGGVWWLGTVVVRSNSTDSESGVQCSAADVDIRRAVIYLEVSHIFVNSIHVLLNPLISSAGA
jgi:hypothetical protein